MGISVVAVVVVAMIVVVVLVRLSQKFRNSEIQKFVILLTKGALISSYRQENQPISEFPDF